MSAGKGDNPRPLSITEAEFAERFDAIDWNAREREAAKQTDQPLTPQEQTP